MHRNALLTIFFLFLQKDATRPPPCLATIHKNNKSMTTPIRQYILLLLAGISATGCDQKNLNVFPDGEYPLVIKASIESPALKSSSEGSWSGSERIAVRSELNDGTMATKTYSTDASGIMNSPDPFFWKSSDETKNVSAWYCGDGSSDADGQNGETLSMWAVRSDQSGDGYNMSDLLYASGSFTYGNDHNLTFYHQVTCIKVNILDDGSLEDASDIASVTIGDGSVSLSGNFSVPEAGGSTGTWTPSGEKGRIIPRLAGEPEEGSLVSYEAIAIPQDLQGQPFILIGLADGGTLKYTPSGEDGKLLPGYLHRFNVTVDGLELKVTAETGIPWGNGDTIDIDSQIKNN